MLDREYTYDGLNQLTKEVDHGRGTTTTYTYDRQGNILKAVSTGTGAATHTYTYGDSTWGDLLTAYDGQSIWYDTIGNPLNYRDGMSFFWENGRELGTIAKGNDYTNYYYNDNGIRISKEDDDHVNQFVLSGDTIVREEPVAGTYLTYLYDETGKRYGLLYQNGGIVSYYYYIYNGQGDVISIVDALGRNMGNYVYDAWGKVLAIQDNSGNALTNPAHIINLNPFRYRGYYYDRESGLYYLNSRYYDPQTGRFINADGR